MSLYLRSHTSVCKEAEPVSDAVVKAGQPRKDLPTYRLADIGKHKTPESGIWVTYKNGVYDITDFMVGHPGGEKILLAAGSSVEPFWELYGIHKNPQVFEILEELRIGNVDPDDLNAMPKHSPNDPYSKDPRRHPALKVNSEKPFNAEVPMQLLADNFITPNNLFFVRNHLPVPLVDKGKFQLEVQGTGWRPTKLSLADLKKRFKPHTITAAVQCAGNRRSELNTYKTVKGLGWGTAAISNAEWTGVLLSDVLEYAGVKEDQWNHILFQGLDKDESGTPYEASIPSETAFDKRREVLLAYEMNGQELPRDHGFPLRVVVPGTIGARQVKWVGKIMPSMEESHSHWQRNDYKVFHPGIDWHNADFTKVVAVQEYPVQSAICEPSPGATVDSDEVTVKGYAWSGGGRGILRVEVTLDGGTTWHEAEIHEAPQKYHRQWAWILFEATAPIPADHNGKAKIMCRATDTSHNTQPEDIKSVWNIRGLINNSWHHVEVKVDNDDC